MDNAAVVNTTSSPTSLLGGISICAGTAIGAGMFSLPIVSSGMWFGWSIACMLLSWFCMYHISLMILEVNMHFREGESFDTLVKGTLGKTWNIINGLLLAFVLYILDYAYISGGGSIVNHTLQSTIGVAPPQMISGLIFALSLSFVIWLSTKAVDRVVTILIVGMLICFVMAVTDLTLAANIGNLIDGGRAGDDTPYGYFVFAALPFYLTAFGFHAAVPSLVKYYGKKPRAIAKSMLYGSMLCFAVYLLWLISGLGNLPREAFIGIVAEGGNIGVLVGAINQVVKTEGLAELLNLFANMAIVSSFLGVSLCLFDFIEDKFNFPDTSLGRFKTAVISFAPPTIAGLVFPNGFIYAIGFAGLAVAINALIITPLMVQKSRKLFGAADYRVWGGDKLVYFIIAMGVFYAGCHVLSMLEILPMYGR